jgi:hypothetical protein
MPFTPRYTTEQIQHFARNFTSASKYSRGVKYSEADRARALDLYLNYNMSKQEVAQRIGCAVSTFNLWLTGFEWCNHH